MSLPQPYIPPGFDDFWFWTVREAESAPFDYDVGFEPVRPEPTQTGQTDPGTITLDHEIKVFSFRGIKGETLRGWIAYPLHSRGSQPAFLWIPPYGRESVMPNQFGTRNGFVSLSFNFIGRDAFYQEKYSPKRGYFADGVLSKESWIFRGMFQNAVIALRVLADQPAVDSARMGTMGLSQGGGMSIWLGAWSERVKVVCADMPFLGAIRDTLMKSVYRYPLKELVDYAATVPNGQNRVIETLAYFDTMNQATRCAKPTLVSVGLKDPAVKPVQARAIYEALPGPKGLISYYWGHDWHRDMIETNRGWLERYLPP